MFRVTSIALLLLGLSIFPAFAAAENPTRIELAENWKLASATEALANGAAISMAGYWMLNRHWPSFCGNLIDYFLSPGGACCGAKKGLRPLSAAFDYYATGDNSQARIIVFNQTSSDVQGLRGRVRIYDLAGKVRDDRSTNGIAVSFNGVPAMKFFRSNTTIIASPFFRVKPPKFTEVSGRTPSLAGLNSKATTHLPFPCL